MNRKNRSSVFLILAALAAVWTMSFTTACYAADTVTLELKDVDVTTAIESLFKGSGKNYIIEPGVYGRIPTLSIKDVEFDQALRLITRTVGLTYRIDQGTYMITAKPQVSAMGNNPLGTGMGPGGISSLGPGGALGQSALTQTTLKPETLDKFTLTYTGPWDILNYIGGGNNNNNNNSNGNYNNNNSNGNYNNNNSNGNYNNNNSNSNRGGGSRRSSGSSNRGGSRGGSSRNSSRNNNGSNW